MRVSRAVTFEEKRAFLSRAEAYGAGMEAVRVVETHMSLVFLTDGFAYKLKKPVHYPYLDFRTLEARENNCREELRLNRRLAKDVYLDVVPLTLTPEGILSLGARGEPVDWLVVMRRLSEGRFLDHVILSDRLSNQDVERVGALLVAFYKSAPSVEVDPNALIGRFETEHETSITTLRSHPFGLSAEKLESVDRAQRAFLAQERGLFFERVAAHQIVEGHGDLRPEHLHLGPPVNIIDCLEFNRWLRLVDPFEELAFLGMECERLGGGVFGDGLLAYCNERLTPAAPAPLVAFYKSVRAFLRARLSIRHLTEPHPRDPAKWPKLAEAYLDLAVRYAESITTKGAR
jgi:aminoglycoside phosphotransferase family enzyme